MKIVKNLNTLKAMQRRGLITFCNQTGQKITGLYSSKLFTCYYIYSATETSFVYKGKKYAEKYLSGCFYPYIIELNK